MSHRKVGKKGKGRKGGRMGGQIRKVRSRKPMKNKKIISANKG
jgi:hypothetical protein